MPEEERELNAHFSVGSTGPIDSQCAPREHERSVCIFLLCTVTRKELYSTISETGQKLEGGLWESY